MLKYGYSEDQIEQMSKGGSVKVYDGKPLNFDKAEPSSARIALRDV